MSTTIDEPPSDEDQMPLPGIGREPSRQEQQPDRATLESAPKKSDVPPKSEKDEKDAGGTKSRLPLIILAVVVIAALIVGVIYWMMTAGLESTDDAYTEGNAVSIAANVSGYVTELGVNDNTYVRKGQLLYRIDPRTYIAARDQARANLSLAKARLSSAEVNLEIERVKAPATFLQAQAQLAQAQANQEQARQNYQRQHAVDPRATTQNAIDQVNAQLKSDTAAVESARANQQVSALVQQNIQTAEDQVKENQAQVAQAEANLEAAEVNLSYTEIRAPSDGYVTMRNVDLGTYVQAGQQSFYLVTEPVWIVANFKEDQLARMRAGQAVTISVDAYPKLHLRGHVDSVQQGSGARFSAFPAENATGNYVKIVRRVPVKIDIDSGLVEGHPLPLGLSVEPTVTVR